MSLRILKPEVFQGSLKKKKYFEGWYFKHVSADAKQVYAFIPGVSLAENDPHSFIQVINGISGETNYISYPLDNFSWDKDRLFVQINKSVFAEDFIDLNIKSDEIEVEGKLNYSELSKYPGNILSPGIMGWYSWVPFMECYHGVVSANHTIKGDLHINSNTVDFNKGKGYIEKDWGTSFPECWIWLQSNSFEKHDASLFVSIAKIPWLGSFFMGFIAFMYLDGKYYKFATYNRSRLGEVKLKDSKLTIELMNRNQQLVIQAHLKNAGELAAPHLGNMSRRIKESIDSEVYVRLTSENGEVLFDGESKRAGLEIIDTIFDYL